MRNPYYQDEYCTLYHGDCLDILPDMSGVDLVMTDPPYGLKQDRKKIMSRGTATYRSRDPGEINWDNEPPSQACIDLVRRLGKYACIWGGNYFVNPPSAAWLIWDKENSGDFADAEMAWTNYGCAVRLKSHMWNGMIRKNKEPRMHPTQKPVDVLMWAIGLAPKSNTIIDPFMGSGTTLVAAKLSQKHAIGIEREEKYCEIAANRLRQGVLAFAD